MAGVTCSDTHKLRTTRGGTRAIITAQEHVEDSILLLVIWPEQGKPQQFERDPRLTAKVIVTSGRT